MRCSGPGPDWTYRELSHILKTAWGTETLGHAETKHGAFPNEHGLQHVPTGPEKANHWQSTIRTLAVGHSKHHTWFSHPWLHMRMTH